MNITNDSIILKFDLPGFDMNDIKINIEEDEIMINAKREIEKKVSEDLYESYEKSSHNFSYSSKLPPIKEELAVIEFKHGVLKITIPKE